MCTIIFFIGFICRSSLETGSDQVPHVVLQQDSGFELNSLKPAEPEQSVISFTRVADAIFFLVRDSRTSASTIAEVKLKSVPGGEAISQWHGDANPIPGYSSSMAATGNFLVYASHGDRSHIDENYITFWAPGVVSPKRVFIGRTKVRELGIFRNGNFIITSEIFYDTPFELNEVATSKKRIIEREMQRTKYSSFNSFLLTPEFHLIKPLLAKQSHKPIAHQSTVQRLRNKFYIHMGSAGELAAVFSRHLPFIKVFDRNGKEIARITHPGKGYFRESLGEQIFFHSDAFVHEEKLFVADFLDQKIYVISLDNQLQAILDTPFEVSQMEYHDNYIYLFNEPDGRFGRVNLDTSGILELLVK